MSELTMVRPDLVPFWREMYREVLPWGATSVQATAIDVDMILLDNTAVWRVYENSSGPVGIAGITKINLADQSGEPVVAIDKPYRGRGDGLAMSRQIIKLAFNDLNLRRLYTVVLEDAQSVGVLKRTGFRKEGVFSKARYRNGEYIDTVAYALLREEYKWER